MRLVCLLPGITKAESQRIDARVRFGLSAVRHVLVKDAGAHRAIVADGVLDSAADEPSQREVLALATFYPAGIHQTRASTGSREQTPFRGFVPQFERRRSDERKVVGFRPALNPRPDHGQAMAYENSRTVVKGVSKSLG